MPALQVVDAVDSRLINNWSATPIIPYDSYDDPPEDAEAFVVVQYPVVFEEKPLLSRTFWERGVIRLVLNVKRGIGQRQGIIWSDGLKAIFREAKFDGVHTHEADGPIVDDTVENGNWISYSNEIHYHYEFVSAVYEPVSV
jgi:hypothetical protein